jgi:MATE family multidrug resistance protein
MNSASFRSEFRPMLRLAAPLALAELGWMVMGIVDTVMAGPLGAAAVGAGSLGAMVFYPVGTAGMGLLFGMDTLVAQSFGAGDAHDCRRTLTAGLWLGLLVAAPIFALLWAMVPLLGAIGTNPRVMAHLGGYLRALAWGVLPLLFYTAFRRYLQAANIVKPVTFALVSANLVNFAGNWLLMYGHWGAPRMGLAGSGWSTTFARAYMAAVLGVAALRYARRSGNPLFGASWRPDWGRMGRLLRLGLPAAGQIGFEGAVFAIVTAMAARLDEASVAAHGIAVNVISTTYMIPLGISSAAAVRVGQAVGRKDLRGVEVAGWTALAMSAAFMGLAGVMLWSAPGWIVRAYIGDAAVIATGAVLLRIAAFFELFDGFQVVATGALRGLGDTRTPMLAHLAGYWALGLPVAWALTFRLRWGAPGIWVGLCAALIPIGVTLVLVWRRKSRTLSE